MQILNFELAAKKAFNSLGEIEENSTVLELCGYKATYSLTLKDEIKDKNLSILWVDKDPCGFFLSTNKQFRNLKVEEVRKIVTDSLNHTSEQIDYPKLDILLGFSLLESLLTLRARGQERVILLLDCCNRQSLTNDLKRARKLGVASLIDGVIVGFSTRGLRDFTPEESCTKWVKKFVSKNLKCTGLFYFKPRARGATRGLAAFKCIE